MADIFDQLATGKAAPSPPTGGDIFSQLAAKAPQPPAITQSDIDSYRLNYFNTDNPNANIPTQAAHALAANPHDPTWGPRISKMSAVGQAAIRQRAQEIAGENSGSIAVGPEGQSLLLDSRGAPVHQPLSQIAPDLLYGHEANRQMQAKGGAAQSLRNLGFAALDPQNAAIGLGMAAVPAAAPLVSTALTGLAAKSAVDKARSGDYGGAAVDALAGAVPALHAGGAFADMFPAAKSLGSSLASAATEHPVSGGGILAGLQRLTSRIPETTQLAPKVAEAYNSWAGHRESAILATKTAQNVAEGLGTDGLGQKYLDARDYDQSQATAQRWADLSRIASSQAGGLSDAALKQISEGLGKVEGQVGIESGLQAQLDAARKTMGAQTAGANADLDSLLAKSSAPAWVPKKMQVEYQGIVDAARTAKAQAGYIPDGPQSQFNDFVSRVNAPDTATRTGALNTALVTAQRAFAKAALMAGQNSAWVKNGLSDADFQEFRQSPEYQAIHSAWNDPNLGVGPLLHESHAANGGVFSAYPGSEGYFHRNAVEPDTIGPAGRMGHPNDLGTSHYPQAATPGQLTTSNSNNFFASGLNEGGYANSWDTVQEHLARTLDRNGKAAIWDEAVNAGLGRDVPRFKMTTPAGENGYPEWTNPGTGEVVRAVKLRNGMGFQTSGGDMIPPATREMPLWFRNEIEPSLTGSGPGPQEALSELAQKIGVASIFMNPADVLSHGANLGEAFERTPGFHTSNPISQALEALPTPGTPSVRLGPLTVPSISLRKVIGAYKWMGVDLHSDPAVQQSLMELAQNGSLPRFAFENTTAGGNSVAAPATQPGLIGQAVNAVQSTSRAAIRTMDLKMRVAAWEQMKRFEAANGFEYTPVERHAIMRSFGNYNPALEGAIERVGKRSGLQPFATARVARMVNGTKDWLSAVGIDPQRFPRSMGSIPRTKAKIVQQFLSGPAKQAIAAGLTVAVARHIFGTEPDDRQAFGVRTTTNLNQGPLGGAIMGGLAANRQDKNVTQGATTGAANQGLSLLGGVPNLASGSLLGRNLYVTPGKDGQPPDLIPNTPPGVENTPRSRALYAALSLFPAARFAYEHLSGDLEGR